MPLGMGFMAKGLPISHLFVDFLAPGDELTFRGPKVVYGQT